MRAEDLPAVDRIAVIVHVDYPEDPLVFADRLDIFPAGCLMAEDHTGATIGYCIAHPGVVGAPPPLDTVLGATPPGADCLYIHDVALLPEARGQGLGASLGPLLEQVAGTHGFARMALTAVSNSDRFWHGLGFLPQPCAKLGSYGDATYRVKNL